MAQLTSSMMLPLEPRLIGLVAAQGQGKTSCATTADEDFPNCKSTVLLAFDLDATISLKARGIDVPTFELSGINDWTIMQKEIEDVVKQLVVRVKDKVTKTIIIDTVSLFDNVLLSYFQSRTPDNFALYGAVAKWHRWFLMEQLMPLTAVGARLIAVFQPNYKEIIDEKKAAEKKVQMQTRNVAEGIEPEADKLLAVSGKIAAKLYRTQCSLIMPIARTKKPGGSYDYWIFPHGGGLGFEYKNRLGFLPEKMPADLKQLYSLIKNHKAPVLQLVREGA